MVRFSASRPPTVVSFRPNASGYGGVKRTVTKSRSVYGRFPPSSITPNAASSKLSAKRSARPPRQVTRPSGASMRCRNPPPEMEGAFSATATPSGILTSIGSSTASPSSPIGMRHTRPMPVNVRRAALMLSDSVPLTVTVTRTPIFESLKNGIAVVVTSIRRSCSVIGPSFWLSVRDDFGGPLRRRGGRLPRRRRHGHAARQLADADEAASRRRATR